MRRIPHAIHLLLAMGVLIGARQSGANGPTTATVNWPTVTNDPSGSRYSPLTQINRDNVTRLQVAWTYRTGDAGEGTTIECTPLVIDGVMYVTTVKTKLVALDAATGKELWKYNLYLDPPPPGKPYIRASGGVNRGVAYWSDGQPDGQRRILLGLADGRLISIDTKSGTPDPAFGKNGTLDLRKDIERDISKLPYGPTSAPLVFENLVYVGCSNSESQPSAPGDVRAFDVRTGKQAWRFHTVPRPGEFGHDTWHADQWKERGGANPWGGFTLDAQRGILFCGTGSVTPDFFGRDRKGTNLFGNCVLALDARTGKRLWHFQTTHHDLWDHDNPCPPLLATITFNGQPRDVVAQVTKTGYCFILDRLTGEPIHGVKEIPAPPSDVPGEEAHPTQPVPLKPPPLARQKFTEEDATDISEESRKYVIDKLKTMRHGGAYEPPSVRGTVTIPGFHGGATWSGASVDPATGLLYVNINEAPYISSLKERNGEYHLTGYGYFRDDKGYPAIKPPWGLLYAIDLAKGEFAWRVLLGEHPALTKKGIPQTGTESFGGTIVTAGGLVFIGGTMDEKFHAFDKSTGKLLWQTQLEAGGYATPSTYMASGKQYVVIAAGGGGKLRTKSGDSFVAFALP